MPTPSFSPGRKWKIAGSVMLSVLAVLALVVMGNYLAARHFRRVQWSSDVRFQLSPVTLQVLHLVTNQVKAVVLFDRTRPLYGEVTDLLNEYQHRCPKLEIEYVDYNIAPGRAKAVESDYKLMSLEHGDRIIFSTGANRRVVYARELSEYDYSALLRGEEVKLTAFKGEQLFTAAIFSLVDPRPVTVYFLQGHWEHDPTNTVAQSGYWRFSRILEENQIKVEKLSDTALISGEMPADCQLLIVAGPNTYLQQTELEKIDKYLRQGGRMLVLFNADRERLTPTGLESLLADWGVEVGYNRVSDPRQSPTGDPNQAVIVTRFGDHPIVGSLARSRLLLIRPRSVAQRATRPQSPDAPKVVELATTSPEAVAIRLNRLPESSGRPIPLMVAVEKGAIQGIAGDRGATRIVVTGDSHFLGNYLIGEEANGDFARNAVNWLLSRDVLLEGIGPRPIKEYRITLTTAELTGLRWLFLAGFPGGALFVGFLVWLRKRT